MVEYILYLVNHDFIRLRSEPFIPLHNDTLSTATMGGDDLDDYDDNQWIQPVRGGGDGSTKESYSHNDSEGENDGQQQLEMTPHQLTGKRQRRSLPESTTPDETTPDTKKSRTEAAARSSSSSSLAQARLLVQAGIDIQNQDSNACAQFLSTLVQHYTLVAQQHNHVTVTTTTDDNDTDTAAAAAAKRSVPSCTKLLLAQYCLGRSSSKNGTTTLMERIKELVAVKQLKQWNVVQSPCIVRFLLLLRATMRFCARSDMCVCVCVRAVWPSILVVWLTFGLFFVVR
jgi:hypothetical protein